MAIDQRFMTSRVPVIGHIRMGLPPGRSGHKGPGALEWLRFTSPMEVLIREIARRYGGEAKPWNHPTRGAQWEVITQTKEVPVFVPRQPTSTGAADPWFEQWAEKSGKPTQLRRCDGVTEQLTGRPCLCDPEGVMERDDKRRKCVISLRAVVLLPEIPGIQGWQLTTHGWNAVDEWASHASMVAALPAARFWPAKLRLDERTSNRLTMGSDGREKVEPREYVVPVFSFDDVTARALAGGRAQMEALMAGIQPEAVESGRGEAPAAIAATAEPAPADPEVIRGFFTRIEAATGRDDMMAIQADIRAAGSPAEAVAAWRARAAVLAGQADAPTPTAVEAAPAEGGEAEPDREDAYHEVMRLAGTDGRAWKTSQVNAVIRRLFGLENVNDANGWQLQSAARAIRAGLVTITPAGEIQISEELSL